MTTVSYKSLNANCRKFGVEFEIGDNLTQLSLKKIVCENSTREVLSTSHSQSINNEYWHVKTDSTCGPKGKPFDSGFEIASYVASGTDLIDIATMADVLSRNGAIVNNNCGFHVHVDVSDFDEESISVLVVRWLQIEHWLKQMVPTHRRRNKYCKFTSPSKLKRYQSYYENLRKLNAFPSFKTDSVGKEFWRCVRPNNYSPYENSQRRVALNLVNFAAWITAANRTVDKISSLLKSFGFAFDSSSPPSQTRPTIEFRFPEGTLDRENVVNWVRLFISFVEMAKNSPLPQSIEIQQSFDQFLCFLGLQSGTEFYLFDEDLHSLKMWIMDRIIKFGTKKYVQQVVKKYEIYTC